MTDNHERLADMLACIERISATASAGRQAFDDDADKQDAILYRLQTIGEAANHLTRDFREQHPEVPWQTIIDLRHILVHGYDQIDLDRIWGIVENRVPELLRLLNAL